MKIFTTTAIIASILAVASATAIGNTFDVSTRSLSKMDGQCTAKGGCKVPGGVHSAYTCWHSECRPEDKGKDCVIAPGMNGDWVAKCPKNNLPYE